MTTKISMPCMPQATPSAMRAAPSGPITLTPEQARALVEEGLRLRQQVSRRFAKMRTLTEDDLRVLTR